MKLFILAALCIFSYATYGACEFRHVQKELSGGAVLDIVRESAADSSCYWVVKIYDSKDAKVIERVSLSLKSGKSVDVADIQVASIEDRISEEKKRSIYIFCIYDERFLESVVHVHFKALHGDKQPPEMSDSIKNLFYLSNGDSSQVPGKIEESTDSKRN